MKYGSLFSGIGGFDSGFDAAGFDCAWQVEKEPSCISVLERHWPNVRRYTDVKDVGAANLEPVDVLVGGFPCQDLSVAGKRAGLDGERSGLWFEFYRIIAGALPRWCVIENVPGLLSSNGGRDFGVIVRGLLDLGYCVAWRVLDAQYFGLAQRRKRVFIVGSLGDGSCAEILFEPESVFGDSPPRREARARVAACLDGSPYADREAEDSRLIASSITTGTGKSSGPRNGNGHPLNLVNVPDIARALQERDAKGLDSDTKDNHLLVMPILEAGARTNCDGYRDGDGIGKPGDPMFTLQSGKQHAVAAPLTAGMSATPGVNRPGRRREDDENLVRATLNSGGNSGGFRTEPGEHLVTHALSSEGADASEDGTGRETPLVTCLESRVARNGRGAPSEIVRPLKAESGQTGKGDSAPLTAGAFGVRRLTPRECERLQGFPDDWTAGQSDSARYRMLGNAVATPVAEWIGRRIMVVANREVIGDA